MSKRKAVLDDGDVVQHYLAATQQARAHKHAVLMLGARLATGVLSGWQRCSYSQKTGTAMSIAS
jgi:hypothetical protein